MNEIKLNQLERLEAITDYGKCIEVGFLPIWWEYEGRAYQGGYKEVVEYIKKHQIKGAFMKEEEIKKTLVVFGFKEGVNDKEKLEKTSVFVKDLHYGIQIKIYMNSKNLWICLYKGNNFVDTSKFYEIQKLTKPRLENLLREINSFAFSYKQIF